MPHAIGFVDNVDGTLAHYKFLNVIRDLAVANGWVLLFEDQTSFNHQIMLQGPGVNGDEQIYVGFRTYHNVAADYYNISVATFTGYVAGTDWTQQPGGSYSGVPLHNQRIDYWLAVNARRIAFAAKVGNPVYESGYVGKFLAYATPGQYPYPIALGGMLVGEAATRFSDTVHSMPYKGSRANMGMRFVDGSQVQPECHPWDNTTLTGTTTRLKDSDSQYSLLPVIMTNAVSGSFGELDGIYHVSGFNNAVENVITLSGVDYVIIQDVARNGFNDFYAIRMDA